MSNALPRRATARCLAAAAGLLLFHVAALSQAPRAADKAKPDPSRSGTLRPADLALEAEQTREPAIRDMYRRLAIPHDIVYWTDGNRTSRVDTVYRFVDSSTDFKDKLKLVPLDARGKRLPGSSATRAEIKRIEPYEEIAGNEVRALLDPKGSAKAAPRIQVLQAAERALSVVARFHDAARAEGTREGAAWDAVGKRLHDQLLQVQADTLRAYADADDWDRAYEMTDRLIRVYKRPDMQPRLAEAMALFIDRSLKNDKDREAFERKTLLQEIFTDRDALAGPMNRSLRRKAAELFEKAKGEKDQARIVTLLTTAENLYPDLEGLREYRLKVTSAYPILYVGVPSLPEHLTPATAATDAERWATELIFESLVRPMVEPGVGERYVSVLAEGRPTLLPLGREFAVAHDALWSDGKRVAGTDVRATLDLLKKQGAAGMLKEARLGNDPYHIRLTLDQGYIDPLALMAFKILPESARLERADDSTFAKKPVGSGPFKFERSDKDAVIFAANPHYRRQGKSELPRIREVRFFVSKDPVTDFKLRRLHLLLDPVGIAKVQNVEGVKTHALPNRRVYFLAVNHREEKLQNENLRKALGQAVNRTKILDEVFRAGWSGDEKRHRVLSSPYPANSWASPDGPGGQKDLYSLSHAKVLAKEASKGASLRLSLKYPEGDPRVARACDLMRIQAGEAGIEIRLEPRSPAQLRNDVEVTHEYELAYYYFDFTSEAYLLWPLFDPQATGRGGSNFLGYQHDAELQKWFRDILAHRDFTDVKAHTRTVAGILQMKMPLIPLWQLDTTMVVHDRLQLVPEPRRLDPLRIFTDVERWEIK